MIFLQMKRFGDEKKKYRDSKTGYFESFSPASLVGIGLFRIDDKTLELAGVSTGSVAGKGGYTASDKRFRICLHFYHLLFNNLSISLQKNIQKKSMA